MVGKVTALFRRLGPVDALILVVSRAVYALTFGRILIRRYYLFLQPLADIPALPRRRGASIAVREIQHNDAVIKKFPRPAEELDARFSAGAECIVAEKDDQLAGFMWFATGSYHDPEANARFNLQPCATSAWDFDVFVVPQLRASFVFYKLWAHAAALLVARGFSTTTSLVWAHNEDSIRSHQRLGARPIASALHISGQKRILYVSDQPPRLRLIASGSAPPAINIDTTSAGRRRYARFSRL